MLPDRHPAEAEARDENEARQKAVEAGRPIDIVLRQEEDVLDTWFSSGLWPFATWVGHIPTWHVSIQVHVLRQGMTYSSFG